ncbi:MULTISPECIES: hypothetical protein [unclassified Brevibacterium]|uniref:hypothetical protein n=1 Tax=unclassified Brevibacterium TaxID=2614124 RepID=UPI001E594FA6|nr:MULTISPECIES: hypothetical protein [unclassified Brevibacterium]MCD1287486.1 hypothetical protein [Brevibacterium sp. CCUG 69071]MDK8436716.1 hypothetical protein [Brevibacterium sp. H-BE7]
MKRLALAAAVALTASTIGVAPAAAETTDSTTELAAQEASPSPGEDATDGEDQNTGEDTSTGSKDGEDSADSDETTPPDDKADEAEGSENGSEESEPIDASLSLDKTEMTVDEAAKAIPYTVTGLKAGDTVTAEPGEGGAHTVDSDGTFKGELRGNTELKEGAVLDVTVTVAREGQESKTLTDSVEITADDDDSDVGLSVDPESQGIDTFLDNGVGMTMSNCEPGQEVKFEIHAADDPDQFYWEDTQKADEDGASFMTFIPGTGADGWIGDFVATATCGDQSADASFTVTEDGDESDADLTVTPKTQKLQDFLNNGVNITLVNCHVDSDVTFRVSTKRDPDTEIWKETQKAGEDAAGSVQFTPDGDGGAGWADEFLVMASCADKSAETTFTVTDDGSVLDPKLSIDPTEISGADFANREKGVSLTATECAADAEVNFQVWDQDSSNKLYDQTTTTNEEGVAGVQVYGLEDRPEAYVGTYEVTAVCMEQSMDGKFVVTVEGSGGGSGGGAGDVGDSDNAGSMPRTGAELTGLGVGALLVIGGALSILVARRRGMLGR